MRGTSMYYQDAKKNLMATLRQNGCPSLFMTLSSAEYQWKELVRQILETEWKQKVSMAYVESLSESERNKIITRSAVQSTVHFQKRVEKIFNLLKYNDIFDGYTVTDFYYRIEFQARGAPHLHALLWLKDSNDDVAPTFWSTSKLKESQLPDDLKAFLSESSQEKNEEVIPTEQELEMKKKMISELAKKLIFGSLDDARCKRHSQSKQNLNLNLAVLDEESTNCDDCCLIKEGVKRFNQHKCTFTCHKKKKTITIKEDEGHGRYDQKLTGPALEMHLKCRFNFPLYPLDETMFILGITKDITEEEVKKRRQDLLKIRKYLIRQTYSEGKRNDNERWKKLERLNFLEFLRDVGMFVTDKDISMYDDSEIENAKKRYVSALSASVRGTGSVFLKRNPKDIFTNNFNPNLMLIHGANHDIQMVVDQYACAQYICGYLTKNEDGMSKLLKKINDDAENLSQMELLNKLSSVLDKHREVSIQEATYRMLGFPMTKSSLKVKYISTCHPNFRDGLLKGNIKELDDTESIFHNSVHTYYENRPFYLFEDPEKDYDPEELKPEYWANLSLAKFWSQYDVIYEGPAKKNLDKQRKTIKLLNGKGYIRRRGRLAVLRYYLAYENTEDFCRGLLILFNPFRDEMLEIHQKDVKEMVLTNWEDIQKNRREFEAHKVMTDIIKDIQKLHDDDQMQGDHEEEDGIEEEDQTFVESTLEEEIVDFEEWAKKQANKHLESVKQYTNLEDVLSLRRLIAGLNNQQRKIFDDIMEREICKDNEKEPYFLFIAGEAGTGKSFLMRILMEGIKHINVKAGNELNKPSIIAMAPTANAAYIIKAKTIDSAMCFNRDRNYTKLGGAKEANLKFLYDDVTTLFCDEISMVGSTKLTKIHYRMQDLADGKDKYKFMGGKSFIATGDMWQLPPVKDR